MKENIATIPVNDIFAQLGGCPLCRMTDMLEKNNIDYITGDAMMVPDVRVETNKKGFCHRHFSQMLVRGKKLPNALILESHLQDILNTCVPLGNGGRVDKKRLNRLAHVNTSCFVCDRMELEAEHLYETVCAHWVNDADFRNIFSRQDFICLKHYQKLVSVAQKCIKSKYLSDFNSAAGQLVSDYLTELKKDITHFCSMFDYKNKGADWGNSKDSINRAITFLTGYEPDLK